jgi:hypothetical protein
MIGADEVEFLRHTDEKIRTSIREAKFRRDYVLHKYFNVIYESCSEHKVGMKLNKDICGLILTYVSVYSITQKSFKSLLKHFK